MNRWPGKYYLDRIECPKDENIGFDAFVGYISFKANKTKLLEDNPLLMDHYDTIILHAFELNRLVDMIARILGVLNNDE